MFLSFFFHTEEEERRVRNLCNCSCHLLLRPFVACLHGGGTNVQLRDRNVEGEWDCRSRLVSVGMIVKHGVVSNENGPADYAGNGRTIPVAAAIQPPRITTRPHNMLFFSLTGDDVDHSTLLRIALLLNYLRLYDLASTSQQPVLGSSSHTLYIFVSWFV